MTLITDATLLKSLNGRTAPIASNGYTYRKAWTKHLDPGDLIACEVGYHYCTRQQILEWLQSDLWIVESCPDHTPLHDVDKSVTCRLRLVERVETWNDTLARLFAADCAEAALLGERASGREPDERLWAAIEAARCYARGEIGDVARATARTAAEAAADVAARAAAEDVAWAAASAAAWAAARAAAGDAAGLAARWAAARWAAARAAARDSAWAAAWAAARAAAWAAAGLAAGDAAWDAAWAAARAAEWERLKLYLNDQPLPPVTPLYKSTP